MPDFGGFDTTRAAHIWKILVSPEEKTLNPLRRQDRNYKDGAWRLAKKNGKPYIDLMWSCGRTSYMDGTVMGAGGCHSAVQSSQPKELQFTNQKMIYDKVMAWQKPVKEGVTAVKAALANINAEIPKSRLSTAQRAQVQLMANPGRGHHHRHPEGWIVGRPCSFVHTEEGERSPTADRRSQCCTGWQEQYRGTQEVAETIVFGGIAPMK